MLASLFVTCLAGLTSLTPVAARSTGKLVSTHPQVTTKGNTCTVKPLGGARDDSSALTYAFGLCSSHAVIDLPGYYVVDKVLNTTLNNVEVLLTGAIQYTPNIAYWSPNSIFLTYQNATTFWLFQGNNILFHGGGTIDGNGQVWWNSYATNKNAGVAGGSSRTFSRPIPLAVAYAKNVTIKDLNIVQSPFWHNIVYSSSYITYDNLYVASVSYNSSVPTANSDGWDIYRSDHVTIKNSVIDNDDDCVSFKPNSTFVTVENLYCNGSHGTSIGSLGQYAGETDIVANIFVKNITMLNAQNGARIKVFGGSGDPNSISGGGSGYVNNVTFQDYYVKNVDYPILIDQCYSTTAAQCAAYPATLSISNVHYINVHGTSSGKVANGTVATLSCSAACVDITAVRTNLSPPNGTAKYICKNLSNSTLDFPCSSS